MMTSFGAKTPSHCCVAPRRPQHRRLLAAHVCLAVSVLVTGCGGNGSSNTPVIQPPVAQPASVSLNVMGTSSSTVSGTLAASDPQGLPLTFTVATSPVVGTASITAASGAFSYTVPGLVTQSTDSFTVSVSNGRASAVTAVVTVQLNGDPLLTNQWHIQNAGRSAFSSVLPRAGNDMNVAAAWAAGYSGRGLKVAVVDSGLEVAHEDLAANVDLANSFNFSNGTSDPSRPTSYVGSDHGTSVAGIIGAAAFNNKGGRGVAYNARLRGYNYLENQSLANFASALGGMTISADNAVFNASFGASAAAWQSYDLAVNSASGNLLTLRGGLGAVLVNAAGNDFESWDDPSGAGACSNANTYGVSCGDPLHDKRLSGITPLIVGALNADGVKSSYSSAGSALWVSAPGGEYGRDAQYVTSSDPNAFKPAIVTTGRTGCANTDLTYARNALDSLGANPLAAKCQYTALMNGTSSAAPNVSGVVALMLEANPNLGWRDVRYILARTARKVDPALGPVTTTRLLSGRSITLDQGWVQNAAGYWFSNWYGFGAVDAAAAVSMAKSYASNLPAEQQVVYNWPSALGLTVPAASTSGLTFTVNVSAPFTTVEHVLVFPNIILTPAVWCNQIEVVSPSGTKSILLHAANGFSQSSAMTVRALSNAFYGEPVNGTWKLTFFNFCSGTTYLSFSEPQEIMFIGR
jgi:subtilisin family serine protease